LIIQEFMEFVVYINSKRNDRNRRDRRIIPLESAPLMGGRCIFSVLRFIIHLRNDKLEELSFFLEIFFQVIKRNKPIFAPIGDGRIIRGFNIFNPAFFLDIPLCKNLTRTFFSVYK
jgi:hypothetical protein